MVPPFQAAAQQQQQQQEPVRVAHEQVGKFDTFQVASKVISQLFVLLVLPSMSS